MLMLDVYRRIMQEHLALPVIYGEKSANERFPGAENTFSCEAMMSDKKALQAGTSHFLGQNFARAFDISFQGKNGEMDFAWTTSWGASTRLIGAIIMTHSDNDGLVLPPKVAPVKAVVIPISSDDERLANDLEPSASKIARELNVSFGGFGAEVDMKYHLRPGDRFFYHIQRGVPIRIELGEKEYASGNVTIVRRDSGAKEQIPFDAVSARVGALLTEIQENLYERAKSFREENTFDVSNLAELKAFFKEGAKSGFARAFFAGSKDDEKDIKDLTGGATIRCMPLNEATGKCVVTGQDGARAAIFAKSY
jgi:prolyl-tRNA synthetase